MSYEAEKTDIQSEDQVPEYDWGLKNPDVREFLDHVADILVGEYVALMKDSAAPGEKRVWEGSIRDVHEEDSLPPEAQPSLGNTTETGGVQKLRTAAVRVAIRKETFDEASEIEYEGQGGDKKNIA